jgi:hypothetical protein
MTSKLQQRILNLQTHCELLHESITEPTFEKCLEEMYWVVNFLWDNELEVDRVSVTRSVAELLGMAPDEMEREIWMTGHRSPLGLKIPMLISVAELPAGMLLRAEGLVTYPIWLKV